MPEVTSTDHAFVDYREQTFAGTRTIVKLPGTKRESYSLAYSVGLPYLASAADSFH